MNPNFIFERMMEYIINDDFTNARLSIMSDITKMDDYKPIYGMHLLSANNNLELIIGAAGFSFMSKDINKYYANPKLAISEYKNKFNK